MYNQGRVANALGGNTARACDSCLTKRARWFCASDDAFLCQACDASVHSANQVASRHERIRLETSSSKTNNCSMPLEDSLPAWQGGFTKRARTSRNSSTKSSLMQGQSAGNVNAPPLVPELGSDETSPIDDDEQITFRVPIFDPFNDELCNNVTIEVENIFTDEISMDTAFDKCEHVHTNQLDDFSEFLSCDMDLSELAKDVENLLGNGIDEEFELQESRQDAPIDICFDDRRVKDENDQEFEDILAPQVDATLNCDQFHAKEEEVDRAITLTEADQMRRENEAKSKRQMFLKLNYDAVLTAWDGQGMPWTSGNRPDDCWLDLTGSSPIDDTQQQVFGGTKREVGVSASDGGREARVSRYKEKRRTRLFSKKIRYEVRKLNAEKRPRIKGRFVKRTSLFACPPNPDVYPYHN